MFIGLVFLSMEAGFKYCIIASFSFISVVQLALFLSLVSVVQLVLNCVQGKLASHYSWLAGSRMLG